jgi:hypothetical protein
LPVLKPGSARGFNNRWIRKFRRRFSPDQAPQQQPSGTEYGFHKPAISAFDSDDQPVKNWGSGYQDRPLSCLLDLSKDSLPSHFPRLVV